MTITSTSVMRKSALRLLINIVQLLNKINEIQSGTEINNQNYYTNVMQKSCPQHEQI
jgi:hypothetical protein